MGGCAQVWLRQAEEGDEETFFSDLPHSLRHDAMWHLTSKALNSLPLFRDLDAPVQVGVGGGLVRERACVCVQCACAYMCDEGKTLRAVTGCG